MIPYRLDKEGCHFCVWAPEKKAMTLHLVVPDGVDTGVAMVKDEQGYFHTMVAGARAGDHYYYMPEGEKSYPDPASQYQPEGVHGPSEVVDHTRYDWKDDFWRGRPFSELVFYEVHVGTFTAEGTFEAMIPRLAALAEIGINAIELMPVAQNPGGRNWGYDAVFPYAVQNNYGGPEGLKKLVDACHHHGIAVFVDVVYNHFGKEGNYLHHFGPYCSEVYKTPWGKALNFDGAWSDGVRRYIIGNVLHWAEHYHVDGLRFDAIHEIFDRNAISIWDLLHAAVKEWEVRSGRKLYLVAESDLNSPRTVAPAAAGGKGFDAQWLDDFHHALYVLLDPDGQRHYADYGLLEQLAKGYEEGFVHSGEYVQFRHRSHGASSAGISGERFLIFNQNHDLPGNRPDGQRLSMLVDFPRLKLAAAAMLLAPYVPLLFMGEEYGEDTPFYFFSDYGEPQVAAELKKGRVQQFAAFDWGEEPPDSQDEAVFTASKLQWNKRSAGDHARLLEWYRRLLRLRREHPLLSDLSKKFFRVDLMGKTGLCLYRHSADHRQRLVCLFNLSSERLQVVLPYGGQQAHSWKKLLASTDDPWQDKAPFGGAAAAIADCITAGGPVVLPPWCAVVYEFSSAATGTE
jgi:maltooligosyltrehalose trehalohydrolase